MPQFYNRTKPEFIKRYNFPPVSLPTQLLSAMACRFSSLVESYVRVSVFGYNSAGTRRKIILRACLHGLVIFCTMLQLGQAIKDAGTDLVG